MTDVAALIISQFGRLSADGDIKLPPQTVENILQQTTVDIGLPGYDECFGNGRIDALRAVTKTRASHETRQRRTAPSTPSDRWPTSGGGRMARPVARLCCSPTSHSSWSTPLHDVETLTTYHR